MNTMKKNGGFTLVELIIVIAILAILSTAAIAGYSTYIKNANNAAVDAILSDISTSAVLANAESGAIGEITVTGTVSDDNVTLSITIKPATDEKLASNFDDNIKNSISKATGVNMDAERSQCTFKLEVNKAWASSKYADKDATGAKWDGSWNVTKKAA